MVLAAELKECLKADARNNYTIGAILTEANRELEHGKWGPWLDDFGISEKSSRNYMAAHRFKLAVGQMAAFKSVKFTDLKLRPSAVYLLAEMLETKVFQDDDGTRGNLTILKRLCRKGGKDDALDPRSRSRGEIPMTQFLAFCHRVLREFFGIRCIMAYSDPAAGHDGGIYRAANFVHLGTTKAEQHVQDADGRIMHRRGVYHYRRRCGVETVAQVRDMLGLSLIMTPPKDRWFIDLSREWPWPWLSPTLRSANVVKMRKTRA